MEQNVERVTRFLQEAGTYYLATAEGTSPGSGPSVRHTCLKESCTSRPER